MAGGGYDQRIDWWSLGATLYECIFGKTPFQDVLKKSKQKELILKTKIPWNLTTHLPLDCDILNFTTQLLDRDPSQRLAGDEQGKFIVNKLPIFSSLDWDSLLQKKTTPPFCPNSQKPNFDMSYDLEELLLENNPLESLPSKRSKKLSKMSADMLYLEESYLSYDFYDVNRGRRHSADYSLEPFPGQNTFQVNGVPFSAMRRSSKSCADIQSMCKQGMEKTPSYSAFDEISPSSNPNELVSHSPQLSVPSDSFTSVSDYYHINKDSPDLPKPLLKPPGQVSSKEPSSPFGLSSPAPDRLVARSISSPSSQQ